MKELLIYLLKTGLFLSLFWIVYELFLKRETFFVFIRGYLVTGLFLSALLPFYSYSYDVVLPLKQLSAEMLIVDVPEIPAETFVPVQKGSVDVWYVLGMVYWSSVILFTIIHLRRIARVFQLIRQGCCDRRQGYTIINHPEGKQPFSMLHYIFIDLANLPDREKEVILEHEKHHIHQRHWMDLLICELFLIFHWFNPILRRYVACIKNNHEYLADGAVLKNGTPMMHYKELLISQTLQHSLYSFNSSFNYSPSKRLFMISKKKSSAWKKVSVLTLLPLFGVWVWASATPNYVSPAEDERDLSDHSPLGKGEYYLISVNDSAISVVLDNGLEFKASAPQVVSVGEAFELTYTINADARDFNIPEITDFKTVKDATIEAYANKKEVHEEKVVTTIQTTYRSYLVPVKEGTFMLPEATVNVNGVTYKSTGVSVTVVPAGNKPQLETSSEIQPISLNGTEITAKGRKGYMSYEGVTLIFDTLRTNAVPVLEMF